MTDNNLSERAITRDAVADMLGVSLSTVQRLVRCGELPAPIRVGGSPRWLASEIAAWLRERRGAAATSGEVARR